MKIFKATKEEQDFFREFVPGHTYKEIQAEFCKRFNKPITLNQVKGYLKRNGLKTGTDGRFKKGQTPYNKGIKGWYAQGMEKNWFKKGNIPPNYKPVGSERINKDGYIEIKVKDPTSKLNIISDSCTGFDKNYIFIRPKRRCLRRKRGCKRHFQRLFSGRRKGKGRRKTA